MPRGYRCIVLAAFGWLVLANGHPQAERAQKQTSTAQAIEAGSEEITNAIAKSSETGDYQKPCDQYHPQTNKYSDLCAQWTAADAAVSAAFWTKIGALLAGLSVVGLGATIFLTLRAIDNDNRPWLHVEEITFDPISMTSPDGLLAFIAKVKIKNIGRTAASRVVLRMGIAHSPDEAARKGSKGVTLPTIYVDNVLPETRPKITDVLSVMSIQDAMDENGSCFAMISLQYRSPGSRRNRHVTQIWTLASKVYRGTPVTLDRPALERGEMANVEAKLVQTIRAT